MRYQDKPNGFSMMAGILITALILLGGGVLYHTLSVSRTNAPATVTPSAEYHDEDKAEKTMGKEETMMGPGVVLQQGRIMLEEGKKVSPLKSPYVFATGVTVSLTGTVTENDGTIVQLKEGESVWQDGSILKPAEAMRNEPGTPQGGMMATAGSYEEYAPEKLSLMGSRTIVIFFHAPWCPTCRALDADIKAHLTDIPSNLTILKTDYDSSTALKQKYGVTVQSTLVQVDSKGTLIKKWTGNGTFSGLLQHVQ